MASAELMKSWARTEALLLEARRALPEGVLVECREHVARFDEFIAHNELGLALDALEEILEESNSATPAIVRSMRLAAEGMGRG